MIENEYLILRNKNSYLLLELKKETSSKMYTPF